MTIKDFISSWLEKGNHDENEYNKFFSYYVALNYLYNHNFEEESNEKVRLTLFIAETLGQFGFKIDMQNYPVLIEKQINNTLKNKPCKYYKLERVKQNNLIDIFLMIYQIRCNLFHGGKELLADRDLNLVAESNQILKLFLEEYLKHL